MKNRLVRRCSLTDVKERAACILLLVLTTGVWSAFAATIQPPARIDENKTVQALAQQPPAKDKAVQDQAPPEKIVVGPQNIKERTAIYVFVGWLWAAIVVLVYITRLEIKEVDRLLELKFYPGENK